MSKNLWKNSINHRREKNSPKGVAKRATSACTEGGNVNNMSHGVESIIHSKLDSPTRDSA